MYLKIRKEILFKLFLVKMKIFYRNYEWFWLFLIIRMLSTTCYFCFTMNLLSMLACIQSVLQHFWKMKNVQAIFFSFSFFHRGKKRNIRIENINCHIHIWRRIKKISNYKLFIRFVSYHNYQIAMINYLYFFASGFLFFSSSNHNTISD